MLLLLLAYLPGEVSGFHDLPSSLPIAALIQRLAEWLATSYNLSLYQHIVQLTNIIIYPTLVLLDYHKLKVGRLTNSELTVVSFVVLMAYILT